MHSNTLHPGISTLQGYSLQMLKDVCYFHQLPEYELDKTDQTDLPVRRGLPELSTLHSTNRSSLRRSPARRRGAPEAVRRPTSTGECGNYI